MTVTTEEAARIAGVTPVTIRQWVRRGKLEPIKRKTKPLRFNPDDVARAQYEGRPKTWRQRHAETVARWNACEPADHM